MALSSSHYAELYALGAVAETGYMPAGCGPDVFLQVGYVTRDGSGYLLTPAGRARLGELSRLHASSEHSP